jgi:hypothetical protein
MKIDTFKGCISAGSLKQLKNGTPLDKSTEDGGKLEYRIYVNASGTYTVFAKTYWLDGGSNSFWIKFDSSSYQRLGNDGFENQWIQIVGPTWNLDSGYHTLTIREREPGARIASIYLSRTSPYIYDKIRFTDSTFVSDSQQLLLDNPYIISSKQTPSIHVFFADTGVSGVFSTQTKLPLIIKDEKNKVLFKGTFPTSQEIIIQNIRIETKTLKISFGELNKVWQNYSSHFDALDSTIAAYDKNAIGIERDIVYPTLKLYRENIVRGYKKWRQDETGMPSINFVDSQFLQASNIVRLPKSSQIFSKQGIYEFGYFSKIDSQICPCVFIIPIKMKSNMPCLLYFHGSNGTHWELERNAFANNRKLSELKIPAVCTYYRGNSGLDNDTVLSDVEQLINYMGKHLNVDTTRLIISGFSMGGFATWKMAYRLPYYCKALIPIAGGGRWDSAESVLPLPKSLNTHIIIIHSPEDMVVPIKYADEMATVASSYTPVRISYSGGHLIPSNIFSTYNSMIDLIH